MKQTPTILVPFSGWIPTIALFIYFELWFKPWTLDPLTAAPWKYMFFFLLRWVRTTVWLFQEPSEYYVATLGGVFLLKKRMMGECSKQAQKSSAVVDPCDTMTSLSFQTHLKFGTFIDFIWHRSDWSNVLCKLPKSSASQKTRRKLFGWSLLFEKCSSEIGWGAAA